MHVLFISYLGLINFNYFTDKITISFCIRATYGVEKEDGGMFTVKVPRVMLESRKDKDDFPNISPPAGMV